MQQVWLSVTDVFREMPEPCEILPQPTHDPTSLFEGCWKEAGLRGYKISSLYDVRRTCR